MSSPNPSTLGWFINLANSCAVNFAPEVSSIVAGTQEGSITKISRGNCPAASNIY